MSKDKTTRRFLKTRQAKWASMVAQRIQSTGLRPNQVSLVSILFAAFAGASLLSVNAVSTDVARNLMYFAVAVFIQLRLLCNLLDGMLAVEGGLKTKLGEIFNELPDRIADSIILVCAGYSISYAGNTFGITLGWIAALLALYTAYIRVMGVSLNTNAYFNGPMAKQHRMFTLTLGCLLAIVFGSVGLGKAIIASTLILIIAGSLVTCIRRTIFVVKEVNTK